MGLSLHFSLVFKKAKKLNGPLKIYGKLLKVQLLVCVCVCVKKNFFSSIGVPGITQMSYAIKLMLWAQLLCQIKQDKRKQLPN